MNVKFYLNKQSIVLSCYPLPKKRLRWYTGEKATEENWNKKKQRVEGDDKHLNFLLDEMERFCQIQRRDFLLHGKFLTPEILEGLLDQRFKGINEQAPVDFYGYVNDWLELKEKTVKKVTFTTYKNAIKRITDNFKNLNWNDFNKKFTERSVVKLKQKGYSMNSIAKAFNVLRTVLNDAMIDNLHNNRQFKTRGFVPSYEDAGHIYLTVDELDQLYKTRYNSERLRNAVNLFLIGCYTGQRFQTYSLINKTMIYETKGVKMISLVTEKTGARVSIPITGPLQQLLEYEPRRISGQKLRDYIKEAAEIAGVKKSQSIGTHTARRSFATNMLISGVPKNLIMSITGHKTETEFNKYVRYDDIQAAIQAAPYVLKVFGSSTTKAG